MTTTRTASDLEWTIAVLRRELNSPRTTAKRMAELKILMPAAKAALAALAAAS